MNRSRFPQFAIALLVCLCFCAAARAGTVTGVVRNGTTNKPAAGVDVLLIELQGGMQTVGTTKTDAAGNYHFDNDAIGQGPMLIRAVYHGVFFHQPLTPGTPTADVTVYETTSNPDARQIQQRLVVFQPNGNSLIVGEEYSIENQSQPPAAFYDQKGDFEFMIPDGAQLSQVSAWGPSGMPVVQGTIDRAPNRYAIAFAFQPGDNGVRISYEIPYGTNSASLALSSPYAAAHMMIAAPPTVQVASDGFQPGPAEQGYSTYTHDDIAAGAVTQISVSGTAPPPAADDASGSGSDQGGAPDQVNGRDSGDAASGSLQVIPPRLDSLRWYLVGGFAALFAVGLALLWRRTDLAVPLRTTPAIAGDSGGNVSASAVSAPARSATLPKSPPVSAAPPAPSETVEQAQREVVQSLDGMKDTLFRLELRRQAGTISEEDYARERARLEKVLHDLLRG
ncbi:MAG: hypothetical protein WBF06_05700 [Candidatus Acidiferrales bacterium]